jgi:hypothetical protein
VGAAVRLYGAMVRLYGPVGERLWGTVSVYGHKPLYPFSGGAFQNFPYRTVRVYGAAGEGLWAIHSMNEQ